MKTPLRAGAIQYINSYPVDYALSSKEVPSTCEVTRQVPAQLNRRIECGLLDVSAMSSLYFAKEQSRYCLLPHYSISSESGVKSVLLFSKIPLESLSGKSLAVTPEAYTTPVLLDILLQAYYGVMPSSIRKISDKSLTAKTLDAFLVIGDEALNRAAHPPEGFKVYDLAQLWRQWTGKPFVFALWAARREVVHAAAHTIQTFLEDLQSSREWALRYPARIIEAASRSSGLSPQAVEAYFKELRFDFDEDLKEGLDLFYQLAHKYGYLDQSISTRGRLSAFDELISR